MMMDCPAVMGHAFMIELQDAEYGVEEWVDDDQ